jgi:Fe-S cluster assembly protein SufD
MGSAATVLEQYTQLIAARSQQRRDPAWLQQLRAAAQQRLAAGGLPGKHRESWHYSAADLWLQQFGEQQALAPIAPDERVGKIAVDVPAGHHIRFNHGYLVDQQIGGEERDKVSLQPLSQLDEGKHAALLQWLGAGERSETLADLITALAPETWVLTVKADARLQLPIAVSHLASQRGCHIGQLLIWMQPGAHATLLQDFSATAGAGDYLNLAHTAILLERDSGLIYTRLNRDGASGQHLGVVEARVGQGAHLQLQTLASGIEADLRNRIRNGFHVRLAEAGAEFTARGAFAAKDRQHIDYHFNVEHRADHGRSDVLMQGLAAAKSRGVVNGRIFIAPDTRGNDGHFTSHNLLLSADAEIDAKPELEIYADEVSCAHGATIGQLDEDQLLYLQTRGIDRAAAIVLMTEGFLKAGLLDTGNGELNDYLQQQLLANLRNAGGAHA